METEVTRPEPIEVFKYGESTLEILSVNGRPDVAEVYVGRMRDDDRCCIEFVDGLDTSVVREKKWIINISTQFGCPVGCIFCDAGGDFRGNLTVEEMLSQAMFVAGKYPELTETCPKLKVHFARMGEPALNDAVVEAMAALPGLIRTEGLWACVPTVAPAGRESWFERLIEVKNEHFLGRFQLQFSVNSTDQDERKRLMPIKLWELDEISRYGERFFEEGDRKVVLNFALIDGVDFSPQVIADHFSPDCFAVKLTPINPTHRGNEKGLTTILRSAREEVVGQEVERMQQAGFDVVISVGDGREDEIGSNCGQAVRRLGLRDGAAA